MSQFRRDLLRFIEVAFVGLFLVQGVRYLYATLYARASSADLAQRVPDPRILAGVPGVVELSTVRAEITAVAVLLALPILALLIHRWRLSFPLAVILIALGRSMTLQVPEIKVYAAGLVVGGGLLYLTLTIIRRPFDFPPLLLLGFTADQLVRALDHTYDRTWQRDYTLRFANRLDVEMGLIIAGASILLILLSLAVWAIERQQAYHERQATGYAPPLRGTLNAWGGLALGGMLYLELTLLALPNAIAHWSGTEYTGLVPWLLAATALPLVPEVRDMARRFAGMFDGAWRGWLWALLLGLLLVIGRRYDGILAGIALVFAQFQAGLTLWWLVQAGLPRRNFSPLAVLLGAVAFLALAVGDYFTYDYAYVRDLAEPYQNVSQVLRSFRNMGLGLALIAAFLLSVPMILTRRRIPWRGGKAFHTLLTLGLVLLVSFVGATAATQDTLIRRPLLPDCLRVATYNIHGGYSQFFDPNLEQVAQLIELNGADIVLLQEVDTGRLASFGTDQALWLARRLEMEAVFFPLNEALQGLVVLSRVPIVDAAGRLLPSQGNQAGALHVSLAPEQLVPDPQAAELGYLHLYNAWIGFRLVERDGQPIPEGEQDQNRQMKALLDWIAVQHGPNWTDRIMLGGTFNYGPDSPLYDRLRLGTAIQDPFASLRAEDALTVFLVDGTAARFDYLWTFNLPLTGVNVDQSAEAARASDHRPAIVAIARRAGVTCQP